MFHDDDRLQRIMALPNMAVIHSHDRDVKLRLTVLLST